MNIEKDNQEKRSVQFQPILVYVLLGILIFIYFFPTTIWQFGRFGLDARVWTQGQYWRLFTYLFLHANFFHLLLNCIFLLVFGIKVERILGHWRFICIYTFSGVLGGLPYSFGSAWLLLGASGVIFGLIGSSIIITSYFETANKKFSLENWRIISAILIGLFGLDFIEGNFGIVAHIGGLIGGGALTYFLLLPRFKFRDKSTSKFFELETNEEMLRSIKIISIFLFTSFILNFESNIFFLDFFWDFLTTRPRFALSSALVPIKFYVAVELWKNNKKVYWLLWISVGVSFMFLIYNIAELLFFRDDSISVFHTTLGIVSSIALNLSIVGLFFGKKNRVLIRVCIALFLIVFIPLRMWGILLQ